ncbi:MAG: lysozyme inhibitor LprI family protein, partial [Plesiomonas shigelloides]
MKKVLIASLLLCGPAFGASFDCAKAVTPLEKLICDDPYLSALDESLAGAYKVALVDNPKVKKSQREWVREVRKM